MDPDKVVELALTAGETMMACGAETYRVEDTMRRILASQDFEAAEVFAATPGVFASCKTRGESPVTGIKRVNAFSTDFAKIIKVNEISRRFTGGEISRPEAAALLAEARKTPHFPRLLRIPALGAASFCFAYLTGGTLADSLNALITGVIIQFFLVFTQRLRLPGVLTNIAAGLMISAGVLITLNLGLGHNLDKAVIGALTPLLPGLPLTNAVRDFISGDLLSGTSRMMDAVLTAVALAAGVGAVMELWLGLFGGFVI